MGKYLTEIGPANGQVKIVVLMPRPGECPESRHPPRVPVHGAWERPRVGWLAVCKILSGNRTSTALHVVIPPSELSAASEYAIESVVETVRSATGSLAQNKKLSLKTEVAKPFPIGIGDEQRLTQDGIGQRCGSCAPRGYRGSCHSGSRRNGR